MALVSASVLVGFSCRQDETVLPEAQVQPAVTFLQGDAWCNSQEYCFPNKLGSARFLSRQALEFSGRMSHFLELAIRVFLFVLLFPPLFIC